MVLQRFRRNEAINQPNSDEMGFSDNMKSGQKFDWQGSLGVREKPPLNIDDEQGGFCRPADLGRFQRDIVQIFAARCLPFFKSFRVWPVFGAVAVNLFFGYPATIPNSDRLTEGDSNLGQVRETTSSACLNWLTKSSHNEWATGADRGSGGEQLDEQKRKTKLHHFRESFFSPSSLL